MTYPGNVKVGGPADSRAGRADDHKVAVGPMDNNAYLLRCRPTDEQVLIDAANEAPTLLELIGDGGLARSSRRTSTRTTGRRCAEVVAGHRRPTVAGRYDAEGIPCPPTAGRATATPSRSASRR